MESIDINKFVEYCNQHLDFSIAPPSGYNSAPLCALDSVFSIRARYETVIKTVQSFLRICGNLSIDTSLTTSEALNRIGGLSPGELADELGNHQRTDPHPKSILKADAFLQFLKIMREYQIETCDDILANVSNELFQNDIKSIRGQTTGLTLDYLFSLAKSENHVKADSHIKRFVKNALHNEKLKNAQIIEIIRESANHMNETTHKGMTARHLDYLIWCYQSNL